MIPSSSDKRAFDNLRNPVGHLKNLAKSKGNRWRVAEAGGLEKISNLTFIKEVVSGFFKRGNRASPEALEMEFMQLLKIGNFGKQHIITIYHAALNLGIIRENKKEKTIKRSTVNHFELISVINIIEKQKDNNDAFKPPLIDPLIKNFYENHQQLKKIKRCENVYNHLSTHLFPFNANLLESKTLKNRVSLPMEALWDEIQEYPEEIENTQLFNLIDERPLEAQQSLLALPLNSPLRKKCFPKLAEKYLAENKPYEAFKVIQNIPEPPKSLFLVRLVEKFLSIKDIPYAKEAIEQLPKGNIYKKKFSDDLLKIESALKISSEDSPILDSLGTEIQSDDHTVELKTKETQPSMLSETSSSDNKVGIRKNAKASRVEPQAAPTKEIQPPNLSILIRENPDEALRYIKELPDQSERSDLLVNFGRQYLSDEMFDPDQTLKAIHLLPEENVWKKSLLILIAQSQRLLQNPDAILQITMEIPEGEIRNLILGTLAKKFLTEDNPDLALRAILDISEENEFRERFFSQIAENYLAANRPDQALSVIIKLKDGNSQLNSLLTKLHFANIQLSNVPKDVQQRIMGKITVKMADQNFKTQFFVNLANNYLKNNKFEQATQFIARFLPVVEFDLLGNDLLLLSNGNIYLVPRSEG